MKPSEEPARLVAIVTAAVLATVNLLALVFNWSADLTAAVNGVMAAWIVVAGELVRSKVTPFP